MTYQVTKTYGHELGLSACFRQWQADSHCRHLHGYALAFELVFESETLNKNNWVIDFGSLKPVKRMLEIMFDHKLLVAQDDPAIDDLTVLMQLGLADVLVMEKVGCEAFAEFVFAWVETWLGDPIRSGVRIAKVTCREHPGNTASISKLAPIKE